MSDVRCARARRGNSKRAQRLVSDSTILTHARRRLSRGRGEWSAKRNKTQDSSMTQDSGLRTSFELRDGRLSSTPLTPLYLMLVPVRAPATAPIPVCVAWVGVSTVVTSVTSRLWPQHTRMRPISRTARLSHACDRGCLAAFLGRGGRLRGDRDGLAAVGRVERLGRDGGQREVVLLVHLPDGRRVRSPRREH